MTEVLKVELSPEKTGVVHASEGTRFLGYDIKMVSNTKHVVRTRGGTRRSMMSGLATLEWPMERALKFACEHGYIANEKSLKAIPRATLTSLSEEEILLRYIQELRGVRNYYYSLSKNWKYAGGRLHWLCKASLMKTLAYKANCHHTQMYARLNSGNVVSMRSGKKVLELLPPKLWKRCNNENPDRKPNCCIS